MAITYVDYTATAGQTDFAFNFPYLEDDHVTVEINGVAQNPNSYSVIVESNGDKLVRLNPPGATAGQIVRVRRKSQPGTDLVDFVNGSVLTESELDRAYLHNRYLAEEISELNDASLQEEQGGTNWDAKNKRIKNVGTPTATTDASTKDYVDNKVNQVSSGATQPPLKWQFTGLSGANTTYTVTGAEIQGDTVYDVSIDGLVKEPTADYTVDPDTDTLTIVTTLSGGEDIVVIQRGFGISVAGKVGTDLLVDGSVTSAKIANGSITYAKIQNSVGNNVLLGNDNGADSDVQELTATEAKTLLGLSTVATSGSYNDLNDKPSTGTVVSIASGTGLTGGPITTSGTLGLASIANLRALGNVSGSSAAPTEVEIKDEDAMTSNSSTALATQQSIKAYVDAQVAVSKWDSGWVNQDDQVAPEAVNAGATMVFDHTLGSAAMLPMFSVYAAEDASGTNMQSQLYEYWISSTGVSEARGIQVKSITSSQVTVQLADQGYKALSDGTFSSQSWGTTTNQFTHIRVVLIG